MSQGKSIFTFKHIIVVKTKFWKIWQLFHIILFGTIYNQEAEKILARILEITYIINIKI